MTDKLTAEDRAALDAGTCPDCDHPGFRLGPTAGVAINIQCVTCGHWFNVVRHMNKLIYAERIKNWKS